MRIAFIASEAAPFAKVGGLGDVTTGLTKALLTQGHQPFLILPKYSHIDFEKYTSLKKWKQIL